MEYVIFGYLLINSFLSGMIYAQNDADSESFWFKISWSLVFLLFGSVIILLSIIWDAGKELFTIFQLKFFWLYFFTDYFKGFSEENLKRINDICENHYNTNSIRHRMYRFTAKMLNNKLSNS